MTRSSTPDVILATSGRLLADRGFQLSFDTVAREAGIHRDTVRYHFGSKKGLVTRVVDRLTEEWVARIAAATPDGEPPADTAEVARAVLTGIHPRDGRFDVLPHALRDPDLQEIVAAGYRRWATSTRQWLDGHAGMNDVPDELRDEFSLATTALLDGLAIQIASGTIKTEAAAETVDMVCQATLSRLQQTAPNRQGSPTVTPATPPPDTHGGFDPLEVAAPTTPDTDAPTTRDLIIATARKLLVERGFGALSFDSVAAEIGVDKGTIRYHFRNKLGLVAAVSDAFVHIWMTRLVRHVNGPAEDTATTARQLLLANDAKSGWIDLLPSTLRQPDLGDTFAGWLRSCYALYLPWFALEADTGEADETPSDLTRFGAAITAIIDGLAIQIGLGVATPDEAASAAQLVLDSTAQTFTAAAP